MAYDLKYQSDFYNYFRKLVSVKIYKRDYGAHAPIMLRTVEVKIEVNFQDENTPVIGTGVKVNIINQGEFTDLEDLLTAKEKEFFCAIEYEGVGAVFQGYSICDLNEQQFLPFSNITLQFTDYVRRLEDKYLTVLSNINTRTCVLTIISSALRLIAGGTDPIALYVNSTLFETTMTATADETMLEQLFVDNYAFYSSELSYDALNKMEVHNFDNVYIVLNKILLSLGAFIYFSKNKWVIERQEDAMRAGNWVEILLYPSYVVPSSVPTLRQEYNKQIDFEYVDESQVLEYGSGLQKLELDLQDKGYDTLVFNDFNIDNFLPCVSSYPMAGLTLRQWYYYTSATLLKAGYDFRGIGSYIQWRYPASIDWNTSDGAFYGLYYPFKFQIAITEDIPTELNVSFKMTSGSPDGVILPFIEAGIRYCLIINSGAYAGRTLFINLDGELCISNGIALDMTLVSFEISEKVSGNRLWSVNQSYSFTEPGVRIAGTWNNNNLWQILGSPSILECTICFFPIRYKFDKGNAYLWFDRYEYYYEPINYLGDISVSVTQPPILNKLTYYVEEDFTNTDTIAIDFFDLDNINFSNGFCIGTLPENSIKTKLWSSEQSDAQQPLMDIFARDRFRRYCRTIHKLKGRILLDGYMKPFSVLTDDNLMFNSEYQIKLLLQGYTWDLNNGIYDVEAVEYTEEDILLDETGESPMTIIPTGLMAQQPEAGEHMVVDWDDITGMDGYTLQRSPYSYNPGYYNSSWLTIYTGANNTFNDDMQAEPAYALLPNASTIQYRVSAYNGNGVSLNSAIVTATWYK